MSLEALFATPAALPTVPKLVQQLISSFEREDVAVDEIAAALAADPVLSAKTLRLANSAYFHVSRRVATVDDALRMLGFVMVRNLVVGSGVAGAFKHVKGLDLKRFWTHTLHTAVGARWLAPHAALNADLAFTAGLTHSLGHLVMHGALPAQMASINKGCDVLAPERHEAERAALGYHHAEVAAELAQRWKFPDELAKPLRDVPDPQRAGAEGLAALLHVAAAAARGVLPAQTRTVAATLGLALEPAEGGALAFQREGRTHAMPPLAELAQGMDAMFG